MIIHHLKPSRVMIAGSAVSFIVAAALIASYFRLRAIDPRVTMEFGEGASVKQTPARQVVIATMIDGEVARTADRIGEATALALSAGLYAATEQLNKRTQRSVRDLLAGVAQKGLMPPGLVSIGSEGTFVSAHGSLSVRYRPAPLGIEVVSIGSKPLHGPALIVRVPGGASEEGEARLYIAGRLTGVTVPAPFAPEAELIALGWSPERLRSLK